MKVYVAARFHEKERVREIYSELKRNGHEITLDWTTCQTTNPLNEHQEHARNCALHTIEGVKDCEIFIFLTNPQIGAGSSTELGAALMSNILFGSPRIYVVGPYIDNNFCFYHPSVQRKDTIGEVLEEIAKPEHATLNTYNTMHLGKSHQE